MSNIITLGYYAARSVVPRCLADDDGALRIIKQNCIDEICKKAPHLIGRDEKDFTMKVFEYDGENILHDNITVRVEINTFI
ncbi:hypothetical protein ORI89_07575 [Sphingobacterium sp. UT-1RO-CII-1]|uniref:hypothetical protein n=1 Tax=Sphingobacterium sp. UT-1RO-CII-1 TaxID=2995225 RepID=UPI00227B83B6|nr:hypothetical protein [Sphingobacterium sp. UT-1RO-CII-1]MCY4779505.1 hypothetical protein [Sphingobacterium sp. UT-1RO-CII-1]